MILKYVWNGRVESKGQEFRPTRLDDVLRDAVADLEVAIRNAEARVEIEPLPTVTGEPHQLRQIFQNLVAST